MNTMGKILVIVVLVLALVRSGFDVFNFVASTNWQKNAEEWRERHQVVQASARSWQELATKLTEDLKKARNSVDQHLITNNTTVGELRIALDREEKLKNIEIDKAKVAILNQQKANQEAKRLHEEVKLLDGIVREREKVILALQTDIGDYRNKYVAAQNAERSARERALNLHNQLTEKERLIAKLKAGPELTLTSLRDPSFQNPPPAYVKGSIRKIHEKDKTLVEISLGSDAGLDKDHTLEVYRLSPSPTYLGRLRIVEVEPHSAVGRLMRTTGTTGPQAALQMGDEVASKILR